MTVYYNEIDPFAAQWLRNLIARNLIAPGEVDERSIVDVRSADLAPFAQCHFFAGIGIWSHALRAARWEDDRPIWTGSCPCQPFSGAGSRRGTDDPRHLWPHFRRLIGECQPAIVIGEQVSGPLGRVWLDSVFADLEGDGYACAASDLCSAGVGAPNIRQRLYWVADAESRRRGEHGVQREASSRRENPGQSALSDETALCGMGDAVDAGLPDTEPPDLCGAWRRAEGRAAAEPGAAFDPWREFEWIECRDGKARPTQPGLFPLAPRNPGDVGKLRAYGNAINAVVAREFIGAVMECLP